MIKTKLIASFCISTFFSTMNAQDPKTLLRYSKEAIYGWMSAFKSKKVTAVEPTNIDLPEVKTVLNGPYKNETFFSEQRLPNSAVVFFELEKEYSIESYVRLISEIKNKPVLMEEFNKYKRGETLGSNASYRNEPFFNGKILYGTLLSSNESVFIHENWLKPSAEK